ncbi:MAG: ABC transporter permease [Cyclobacteriaceae bacterium]|nr:ABC transporter permease [Cyclobacteriaceae bacterium]UYN86164.1 MAG: ABC transporter permease [Cyclobacteriaceae bacterium]
MLLNYLKIALRNLQRNFTYSFINIFGLSIGIACSILIMLWIADEYQFDRFHEKRDNLYKVMMNQTFSGKVGSQIAMPYPLKDALPEYSSKIKHTVITNWGEGFLLTADENKITKVGLAVSEDFLKIFTFPLVQGDVNTALNEQNSIVLTESVAKALFGNEDPLNKLVKIDNNQELKVTGVMRDFPDQTTFSNYHYLIPFSFIESIQAWVRQSRERWDNNSFQLYVELEPGSTLEEVNTSIKDIVKKNSADTLTQPQVFLHPVSDLRLYSKFENGKATGGMIEYVRLFGAIAIFVLLIACINFMNLATARSEKRAREVGIRKSIGSRKKELVAQFLGESLLITTFAFFVAVVLVELSLPMYNTLVNKRLLIDYSNPYLWGSAVALILVTGILAGSYPAFYLSSFQPVKVLKGKIQTGKHTSLPRKILVTLQFGFSIFLIIGTIVIYKQIMHVKDREIGFDRENLMMIWINTELSDSYETIKNELIATGAVKHVTKSNSPVTSIFANNIVEWPGMEPGTRVIFSTIATEYDYVKTMGINLLEGRDFSREFNDSTSVIINQAAVDVMGLTEPVGSKVNMWGGEFTIVGVTENVIMNSPFEPVAPMVVVFEPEWNSTITLRLEKTSDLSGAINKVEDVFKRLNPTYPFAYRFADVEFDKKFSSINLVGNLAKVFAALALIITALGLFGLAAFTAEQRSKEVSIRKVLGASVAGLVLMISKDFARLVIFSFVLFAPLAGWFLTGFLEEYPYRITIPWWIYPLAGLSALIVALVIVSTQALRAAVNNPVNSLRNE